MPQFESKKQIEDVPGNRITTIYFGNGLAGGFKSTMGDDIKLAAFSFGAELEIPYWTMHEFTGPAFASLEDVYQAPGDLSELDIYPKTEDHQPVAPVTDDSIGDSWASNCFLTEWNQEAWDAFLALPGNSNFVTNLETEDRMTLPLNYRVKHPNYTGGDYVWRVDYNKDFMKSHSMASSGWSRYLIYRQIMRFA